MKKVLMSGAFRFDKKLTEIFFKRATNQEMTKAIARMLNKTLWPPPVPEFMMKIILGEMAGYGGKWKQKRHQKKYEDWFNFGYKNLKDL